jgi:hypothetical protein
LISRGSGFDDAGGEPSRSAATPNCLTRADTMSLQARLERESRRFGARIELRDENRLAVA